MKARREECKIKFSYATRWYSWRVRLAGSGEMQIYTYGREGQKERRIGQGAPGDGGLENGEWEGLQSAF